MKNLNRILSVLILVCAVSIISANAQITSISQIRDAKPTDKHYQALQSLVEKYGVISDNPFRANDPLTREEFVVLLNSGLDVLMEIAANADEEISASDLIESFSANETNITSTSQIKDIKENYKQFIHLQSLTERYGIDICDKDKYFRPTKTVTEKEFYTWIAKIFHGSVNSDPSATKAITRGEWVIVMNAAFDNVNERIADIIAEKEAAKKPKTTVVRKTKLQLIQELPSSGKAKIINNSLFYLPDNTCGDLASGSIELKAALKEGGIWGNYKMTVGDIGDIVYETNNTCAKGKLVILRVGTALVTIGETGIKRLK